LQRSAGVEKRKFFPYSAGFAMTMAAAIDRRTADAPAQPACRRIARVEAISDLNAAEPIWRAFETRQQFFSSYQRFDFLSAWQHEVGRREDARPFIVIATDAEGRPLLLLPLAIQDKFGIRTACFMGGKHANFNMALWDRDFAANASSTDLEALLSRIRNLAAADVLALTQQPQRWQDIANPFAALPQQPSVNLCPVLKMPPGATPTALISNSFRKRLKSKERKLQSLAGFCYHVADSEDEITRLLDWFFRTKPQRMADARLPNVFADPGVEDFIRNACLTKLADGRRAIDIHALECDEEVIAIFAGVGDGYRFSMMFNTYTMSEHSRYSPGLILIRNIIDHYAASDHRALDLGIGSDEYKRLFCKTDEPIFDSFIPLTSRGRLAAAAMSAIHRGKHLVKQNPALFNLAQRLRGAFH
jgi:CelD/BcsL family acetyltransferase involved in cellulose biosynthesis